MAQGNQNLKFNSKLKGNKPPPQILGKTPTFIAYRGSRKENTTTKVISYKEDHFQTIAKYGGFNNGNFENQETNLQNRQSSQGSKDHLERNLKPQNLGKKLKEELSKYRNELRDFTKSTKHLEEKYEKINSELNEMKQKHDHLLNKRNLSCGDFDTFSDSSSTGTIYSLQRKCNQVFNRSKSFINETQPLKTLNYIDNIQNEQDLPISDYHNNETEDRKVLLAAQEKENRPPNCLNNDYDNNLQNVYLALKHVFDDQAKSQETCEISALKKTINKLQMESDKFSSIIEQQKSTLNDYRLRFFKTQQLVKEQQLEIEQLNSNNQQLEIDTSIVIEELRHKIETKLKDVNLLSDIIKSEQYKRVQIVNENCQLKERILKIQTEANQLKQKLDEMNRRKMITISRLKVAERDLKIFKDYNMNLKQDKRKLEEEMKTTSKNLENLQNANKRVLLRQREQSDKERRDLQKRIFDLEMKLSRSQTSTTSLIQERDTLIAELQSQLNNLVHNFEISQKHIRVLRKHIYNICGNRPILHKGVFEENL
ncbi:uncharacterized protein ACRADG_005092 [Cochliomyia hominivorax]